MRRMLRGRNICYSLTGSMLSQSLTRPPSADSICTRAQPMHTGLGHSKLETTQLKPQAPPEAEEQP